MPEPPYSSNMEGSQGAQRWRVEKDQPKSDGPFFITREEDQRTGDSYMYMYWQTTKDMRLVSYTTDKGPDCRDMTWDPNWAPKV